MIISLTRLDGTPVYINETNVQWIEALPDTVITFLGGSRVIVREKIEDVLKIFDAHAKGLDVSKLDLKPSS